MQSGSSLLCLHGSFICPFSEADYSSPLHTTYLRFIAILSSRLRLVLPKWLLLSDSPTKRLCMIFDVLSKSLSQSDSLCNSSKRSGFYGEISKLFTAARCWPRMQKKHYAMVTRDPLAYLLTYLLIYLLTYLFTYLLHGEESFLRSYPVLS